MKGHGKGCVREKKENKERFMVDFIRGPLVIIAFGIFILGLVFQFIQFFRLTKKKEWVYPPLEVKSEKKTAWKWVAFCFVSLKGTLWKTDPLTTIMTSVFHVCLIAVPIFLLGHNVLLDQSWGLSFLNLPELMTDVLTVVVLVCVAFFLGRRLFLPRVRAITTAYDYLILLIAAAPFLTGHFAYHQWFHYETVMTIHILAGEVMLITIPFTKLGHMLFFFLYRFFIGNEYSFARGARAW
jgi:nitrate reductase gamma subunit